MAIIRPFRALRPAPSAADAVAAVPYDVVSTDEARQLAAGNPLSFLHVSRPEIDLPADADPYGEAVYARASQNLAALVEQAPLVVEAEPSLYLYRMQTDGHEQTGVAGCFSLDEYDRGVIRRHERTRPDKEDDRTRHMLALGAQTGIVFLACRAAAAVDAVTARGTAAPALLDVRAADGVRHTVWRLGAAETAAAVAAFADVPAIYIADGHHRIASAARARDALAGVGGGAAADHPARFVLGVVFPDRETRILPYNRTIADLGGRTPAALLDALRARCPVTAGSPAAPPRGTVSMYLDGAWYALDLTAARAAAAGSAQAPDAASNPDPAAALDAAVLESAILAPVFGVADIRTDPRIAFIGGARGTAALEAAVASGRAAAAFSLAAVTPAELIAVSDAGGVMPPKSTWFEPKLRDGLLIHRIRSTP